MIKTRTWIFILLFLLLLNGVLCIKILFDHEDRTIARIYQNDILLYTIDLNSVTVPYEILVEDDTGKNTVLVEHGRICIMDSDCLDQICVKTGWISGSVMPVVCLPHKLIISLEQRTNMDDFDIIAE